jgi:hypothetical protein
VAKAILTMPAWWAMAGMTSTRGVGAGFLIDVGIAEHGLEQASEAGVSRSSSASRVAVTSPRSLGIQAA